MTDTTGHMNRPGAGPSSYSLSLNGIPINHYINHNPQTGRVEIVKPMPPELTICWLRTSLMKGLLGLGRRLSLTPGDWVRN